MTTTSGRSIARPGRVRRSIALLAFATALLALPGDAEAQGLWGTTLALTGWPLTVTNTTGTDFENGFVSLGSTSFSVNGTSNLFNLFTTRITTVAVQCVAPCPRSGTIPASGLEWRRDDQATWTPLTNDYVDIEQRTMVYNGSNDPWTRSMQWRYVLSWTGNPPAAVSQYRVRFRLLVAAP